MKSRVVAVGVLLLVVVVIAWNALFFGPAGEDVDKAKARSVAAQQQQTQLNAQLKSLQDLTKRGPEFQARIDKLNGAVPLKPDLEGFLRSAQAIKEAAGVDWVSIQPAAPTAGATGPSEITMQIVVSGGFFQVLDYLNRLEGLRRLVVIDGINVTTASDTAQGGAANGGSSTPTTNRNGAPNLTISLNARMFTQALVVGAAGSKPRSNSGAPTTPSSAPGATTPSSTGGAN